MQYCHIVTRQEEREEQPGTRGEKRKGFLLLVAHSSARRPGIFTYLFCSIFFSFFFYFHLFPCETILSGLYAYVCIYVRHGSDVCEVRYFSFVLVCLGMQKRCLERSLQELLTWYYAWLGGFLLCLVDFSRYSWFLKCYLFFDCLKLFSIPYCARKKTRWSSNLIFRPLRYSVYSNIRDFRWGWKWRKITDVFYIILQ